MSLDRRAQLRHAAGLGVATLIPGPLLGLTRCSARRDGAPPEVRHAGVGDGGYGELTPSRDCPELALPPDFTVIRLSVSGDRMRHRAGQLRPVPDVWMRLRPASRPPFPDYCGALARRKEGTDLHGDADPRTDWNRVDPERLRQHQIDRPADRGNGDPGVRAASGWT
jgi:hypothetical protein